ncbi:uncharacterized protein [Choristoneura fumiferana]|uniref:uncharacterized protein n=1 Tax=Choristoneura fumiferana TaxID=7141 RepID=UPI003D15D063
MNQKCKVCGEPAAGFHFGAFTCEGCKSFFGRSYNNLGSITECKNNGECVINKKNRTACKACRLRKCLVVGMSKSGSRYGRRSNWFKIHCLLQEQQQAAQSRSPPRMPQSPHHLPPPFPPHLFPSLTRHRTKEEMALLGLDEYKPPCSGSPDSHRSGSSPKLDDKNRLSQRPPERPLTPPRDSFIPMPLANMSLPHFPHSPFLTPPPFSPFAANHHLLFPPGFHPLYSRHLLDHAALRQAAENNNDVRIDDHNADSSKRFFLDEILKQQRSVQPPPQEEVIPEAEFVPTPPAERRTSESPLQENPMDLSVKSDGRSSSARRRSDDSEMIAHDNDDNGSGSGARSASEDEDVPFPEINRIKLHPLDLTTKV